jgi:hypothetical protein
VIADFRDHMNGVLHRTVTQAPLALVNVTSAFVLGFRRSGQLDPTEVQLQTRFGLMHLSLAQTCLTVREGQEHRLRTTRYRYALRPDDDPEPRFRWEYVREFREGNA